MALKRDSLPFLQSNYQPIYSNRQNSADNATFHRGGRIKELIEAAGCQLKYLPSYSPDLNKIEQCWSWLKSRIRKKLVQFDCLRNAMEDVLRNAS